MNGFVNVIKPRNMSSALAVQLIRKKIRNEFGKQAVGHMGTLDPMASGVLPMGINQANRLFDYLLDKEKVYIAEFTFGYETDTLDATGEIIAKTDCIPSENDIKIGTKQFVGDILQIPPKFSAKNVDGRRGYELARAGIEFELKPKKVTVLSFDLIKKTAENTYKFIIKCKGGTYIRSLCRDLANSLNSKATMISLDRNACGVFSYENGVHLDDFMQLESIKDCILPPDEVVFFEKLKIDERQAKKLLNGVYNNEYDLSDGLYRVYSPDGFWGIGEITDKVLKMKSYVRDL